MKHNWMTLSSSFSSAIRECLEALTEFIARILYKRDVESSILSEYMGMILTERSVYFPHYGRIGTKIAVRAAFESIRPREHAGMCKNSAS